MASYSDIRYKRPNIGLKKGNKDITEIKSENDDLIIETKVTDKDIHFKGSDDGSVITALTLDMSDGGSASFNHNVTVGGDLTVDTNTLYIDATNNKVGIGTTSPDGKLHVETASSGATANTGADELVLEGTGNVGMSFLTSTTGANRIYFGDSDDPVSGVIKYDNNNDNMTFDTNGLERIRIDSSGKVGIGTSSPASELAIQATGAGARFEVETTGSTGFRIYQDDSDGFTRLQAYDTTGTTYGKSMSFWTAPTGGATAERMRINSSGNVGIGTTSPAGKFAVSDGTVTLDVNPTSNLGYLGTRTNHPIAFTVNAIEEMRLEADGDLHVDGDVIAFSTTVSDVALKSDIEVIPNALDKVNEIRGVTFTRHNGRTGAGIIAQELEKVLPEAVREKILPLQKNDNKKYKTVEYDSIHGLLIEAIKELSKKVEQLEKDKT